MSYERDPFRLPVPGLSRETGFGDVVARMTRFFGVRPCGKCKKRQVWLNGRLVLVPIKETPR